MYNIKAVNHTESCPSWPKEHDWKSCNGDKPFVGSNPMLSANKKRTFVYQTKVRFLNDVFRCTERDVHFVRDVSFGRDVRFARERYFDGTHHITFAEGKNITVRQHNITCPSGQTSPYASPPATDSGRKPGLFALRVYAFLRCICSCFQFINCSYALPIF